MCRTDKNVFGIPFSYFVLKMYIKTTVIKLWQSQYLIDTIFLNIVQNLILYVSIDIYKKQLRGKRQSIKKQIHQKCQNIIKFSRFNSSCTRTKTIGRPKITYTEAFESTKYWKIFIFLKRVLKN